MAIKVKKDIVEITQELNTELELYGFQISLNPDNKEDKPKNDIKKDKKTTSKKK